MGNQILFLIFLAALQLPPPGPPPPQPEMPIVTRDPARNAPAAKGTALIRGRVTDQESGQPIPRAAVTVSGPNIATANNGRPLQVRTDREGRYEIKDLPSGDYRIMAEPGEFRATHLRQYFGDARPSDPMRPPRAAPIRLDEGEVRDDVNIALRRAFAIEGRVVDEFGEPMAGVEMLVKTPETGQRAMMMSGVNFGARSDDRGHFRIFGLAPGRYIVCANPRNFGPMTGEAKERPIQTCHPAALVEAEAQPVAVATGDVAGADIRVQRSRAFTVSGIALDSSGAPLERAQISVVRIERDGGAYGSGLEMRPGGQFIARGLTPGDYAVRAEIGSRGNPDDTREREMGFVPFRIESSDLEGLVVTTSKPTRVSGRVIFEDDTTHRGASTMRIMANPDRTNRGMMMMGPQPTATVKPDLTFDLAGLFGPASITAVNPPPDWAVKGVNYKGQDIADQVIDFTGARENEPLEIVLTNRVARLAGRVLDDQGKPPADVQVMLLPADPARWKSPGGASRAAMPKPDGSFEMRSVRPGEYLLVAIGMDDVIAVQPRMPSDQYALFERLARVAQRITLVENDQQTLELRVSKLQ